MDKITVKDLEVFANHGVYEQENFLGQKFVISAVLHTDTRMAGLTDNLENSINYGEVSHLIKKVVEENTWNLFYSCESGRYYSKKTMGTNQSST